MYPFRWANNYGFRYRPAMRLMRAILIGCLSLILLCGSLSPAFSATWQDQMLTSLNSIRAEKGLKPLKMCAPLTTAAQKYARVMATQNFFAHEGKDGSTAGERIQSAGYNWRNANNATGIAENIAAGQASVTAVMMDWKKSTGHYKNMTNSKFTHVGFGMAENQKSTYKKYWVQNFGYGAKC